MAVRHVVEPVSQVEHEESCWKEVAGHFIYTAGQQAVEASVCLTDGEVRYFSSRRGLGRLISEASVLGSKAQN